MKRGSDERLARLERLADDLGDHVASRGVLQHFFCGAVLRNEPMSIGEVRDAWQSLADDMRAGRTPDLLGVYLHVPFCPHKCRYCIYYSVAGAAPDLVDSYLDRVHGEIEFLRPAFDGLSFGTWYVGGGSPTLLNVSQLDRLLAHMTRAFPRREGGQYAFECSPLTISEDKVQTFARHGFNRVSFGVQSLRPDVLDRAGRGYQTPAMVRRAFKLLKKGGFWINADLLFGLSGDSVESMRESVAALLRERPDQVTLYEVSPSTPGAASRGRRTSLAALGRGIEATIASAGYRYMVTPTCLDITRDGGAPAPFVYDYSDMTAEPYSFVGIGPTVRFYLWGSLRAAYTQYAPGEKFDPAARTVLGQRVTRGEEQRRFAVHSIEELGRLDPARFGQLFGALEQSEVGPAIDALVRGGRLKLRDGCYEHALRGPRARFVTMLRFVDDAMLDAAERRVRLEAAQSSRAKIESRLTLEYGGHKVEVAVDKHVPGEPCAHSFGGYVFVVPIREGESAPAGQIESNMLLVFEAYFDEVVRTVRPSSLAQLVSSLMKRQKVLKVTAPRAGAPDRIILSSGI